MSTLWSAGAARQELTPPVGVPTGGGGPDGYTVTTSVLDPLYVRALHLRSSGGDLLLLQADLLGLSRRQVAEFTAVISDRTKVPPAHVLIICPQSHNSGTTFNRNYPDQVLTEFSSPAHEQWWRALPERFAATAVAAGQGLRPVQTAVGCGRCAGICANRRARLRNGRISMAWSDPPAAEVAAWGENDEDVVVVGLREAATHTPVAALWHFTGHPNSLWMLPTFSRDYPGLVEDRLTEAAPGAVALFVNGFCGDVDTYRCLGVTKEIYTYPFYKEPGRDLTPNITGMRRVGQRLADQVVALWAGLDWAGAPWPPPRLVRGELVCTPRHDAPGYAEHYPPAVDLAALRLGPVGFACAPFEAVCALGRELKRRSPAPITVPVGHTPHYSGYLPDQATLDAGGFEAGTSWRGYAPGTAERVGETLLGYLTQMFMD